MKKYILLSLIAFSSVVMAAEVGQKSENDLCTQAQMTGCEPCKIQHCGGLSNSEQRKDLSKKPAGNKKGKGSEAQ